MAARRALLNLLRVAGRDPVWAIFSLVMSPLRLSRHLVLTMLVYLAVWAALIALWHGVKLVWEIPRVGPVNTAAMALIHGFLLLLLWRMLTMPLVRHFGAQPDEATYGSARFASQGETARLAQSTGLLIGREPKSGRLLRYGGLAHFLTMAPTQAAMG